MISLEIFNVYFIFFSFRYHDGKLINYDWIVTYQEPRLLIQTYDEMHKGIYQCVATNVAGEAQVTGLLSWNPKKYTQAPKNLKCLPLNATSFKVQFDGPGNFKVWTTFFHELFSILTNRILVLLSK